MFGDAGQHVAQVGFGIEAVECCRLQDGVDGGGALAAGIGAGEQPVLLPMAEGSIARSAALFEISRRPSAVERVPARQALILLYHEFLQCEPFAKPRARA